MKAQVIRLLTALAILFASATLAFSGSTRQCTSTFGGTNSAEAPGTLAGTVVCTSGKGAGKPSQFISQFFTQFDFSSPAPCTFTWVDGTEESGIQGVEASGFGIVTSFTGDLLFQQDTPGNVACVNPGNGHLVVSLEGDIIGGTGANSGATGSYKSSAFGAPLGPLGWVTGTGSSTINLP